MEEHSFDQEERGRRRRRVRARKRRRAVLILLFLLFIAGVLYQAGHSMRLPNSLYPAAAQSKLPSLLADHQRGPSPENTANPAQSEWALRLVNPWNVLPDAYSVDLTELKNGQSVDSRIVPALQELFDDAKKEGIYCVVASGYRTSQKQQSLMDEKIEEYEDQGLSFPEAQREAKNWVAAPGYSEHQLGLAVDINADGIHCSGEEVYAWLKENAHRYGFILRYPADKTKVTGTAYEPWHYRFVGIDCATQIYEQECCLEEYLDSKK